MASAVRGLNRSHAATDAPSPVMVRLRVLVCAVVSCMTVLWCPGSVDPGCRLDLVSAADREPRRLEKQRAQQRFVYLEDRLHRGRVLPQRRPEADARGALHRRRVEDRADAKPCGLNPQRARQRFVLVEDRLHSGRPIPSSAGSFALAERWNGTSWSIERLANPPGSLNSTLQGVSCPSTTACTAVGGSSYSAFTLVERRTGTVWAIQASPTPAENPYHALEGVSCPSLTACVALTSSGCGELVERWDGLTWSIQQAPACNGQYYISYLEAVRCSSRNACTAVGTFAGSGLSTPLAVRWDGMEWATQLSDGPAGGDLTSVSCSSNTACTAVGVIVGSTFRPLIEHSHGADWSVQRSPRVARRHRPVRRFMYIGDRVRRGRGRKFFPDTVPRCR